MRRTWLTILAIAVVVAAGMSPPAAAAHAPRLKRAHSAAAPALNPAWPMLGWTVRLTLVPPSWANLDGLRAPVTAGEAVVALWRLQAAHPPVGVTAGGGFPAAWTTTAWHWALAAHVIVDRAAYRPTTVVSRAAFLTWVARTLHWSGTAVLPYRDAGQIPARERAAVIAAWVHGARYSVVGGLLEPLAPLTREALGTVLARVTRSVVLAHAVRGPFRWSGLQCPPGAPKTCRNMPGLSGTMQTGHAVLAGQTVTAATAVLTGTFTPVGNSGKPLKFPVSLASWGLSTATGGSLYGFTTHLTIAGHGTTVTVGRSNGFTLATTGNLFGVNGVLAPSGAWKDLSKSAFHYTRRPDGVYTQSGVSSGGTSSGAYVLHVVAGREVAEVCGTSAATSCSPKTDVVTGLPAPPAFYLNVESSMQGLLLMEYVF